jgi:hypothetical protein
MILGASPVDGASSSNTFGSIVGARDRPHLLRTAGQRTGTLHQPFSQDRKPRENALIQRPTLRRLPEPAAEVEIIANRQPRKSHRVQSARG